MAASIKIGQRLSCLCAGHKRYLDGYVSSELVITIFLDLTIFSRSGTRSGKIVIETAPKGRFENERDVLKHFRNRPRIRQLLDETRDPSITCPSIP
jgi:hypothetical protein